LKYQEEAAEDSKLHKNSSPIDVRVNNKPGVQESSEDWSPTGIRHANIS
jgi:hypothetical protein